MYLGRKILARRNPALAVKPIWTIAVGAVLILGMKVLGHLLGFMGFVFVMPIGIALGIASVVLGLVFMTAGMGAMVLTRFSKTPSAHDFAPASPAAPSPAAGWYSPPPRPPSAGPAAQPPPEGGSSDAP